MTSLKGGEHLMPSDHVHMTEMTGTKKRQPDLDIIRIIACFLVVFHHTRAYQAFGHTESMAGEWFYSLFSIVTRANVPLFFMLSGALLLRDKRKTYGEIFRKKMLKILLILPVLTTMLTAIGAFRGYISGFSLETCVRFSLNGANLVGGVQYWYLYAYLGILVTLPFFRRMAKGMTRQDFLMLFFLHFFCVSFLTMLNTFAKEKGIEAIGLHSSFVNGAYLSVGQQFFYPLMGYYLCHRVDPLKLSRRLRCAVFASGCGGVLLSAFFKVWEMKSGGIRFSEEYLSLFDYLTAICLFLLIRVICAEHGQFASHKRILSAVARIAPLTYGMYLFEPFTKWTIYSRLVAWISADTYQLYPNLIYCLLSMTLTGLLTWGLRRIPVVKRLF